MQLLLIHILARKSEIVGREKGQRTGSALYTSYTRDINGAALRLELEAGTEACLPGFEPGGRDSHGGTGAEKGNGDADREVHGGSSMPGLLVGSCETSMWELEAK